MVCVLLLGVFAISGVLGFSTASEGAEHAEAERNSVVLVPGPAINVTKTCPQWPVLGGYTLYFVAAALNGGSVPLTNIRVTDAQIPSCNRVIATLLPGESVTWNCSLPTVITDNSFTSLLNAFATPPTGADVRGVSFCTAVLLKPQLVVEQTCPPAQVFSVGDVATFSVTVRNLGGTKLLNVAVNNPNAPDCNRNMGTIDSLAVVSYTCHTPAMTVNTTFVANVTGTTPTGDLLAYDRSCSVVVATPVPSVEVAQSCPAGQVAFGALATYTVTVTNTGGTALTNVATVNSQMPACSKTIGNMAAGAVVTYVCLSLIHI